MASSAGFPSSNIRVRNRLVSSSCKYLPYTRYSLQFLLMMFLPLGSDDMPLHNKGMVGNMDFPQLLTMEHFLIPLFTQEQAGRLSAQA